MKLSLKIRDDEHHQNPLFRAKFPTTVLGLPFISGIIAGDPSDLCFNLSTNFPTGPSLKLSYTPTPSTAAAATPFSFSLKTGVGLFGSPYNSPLIISAHFNLFSNPNPSFSLQIKPQFGDFSLRKTTLSSPNPKLNGGCHSNGEYVNGFEPGMPMDWSGLTVESCPDPNSKENGGSHSNGGIGFAPERPLAWRGLKLKSCNGKNGFSNPNPSHDVPIENGGSHSNTENGFAPEMPLVWRDLKKLESCNGKDWILSGVAVRARTVLPVTSRLVVNFRWGVNFPADKGSKLPFLTVDKIGVERVEELKEVMKKTKSIESGVGDMELLKGMCFWMGRDLEVLQKENRELKQSLEEMRLSFSARNYRGQSSSVGKNVLSPSVENSGDFERWRSKSSSGEENGRRELKKPANRVSDVESELQKAIKAAAT